MKDRFPDSRKRYNFSPTLLKYGIQLILNLIIESHRRRSGLVREEGYQSKSMGIRGSVHPQR